MTASLKTPSKPSIFSYDHPYYPLHITINVILTTFLAVVSAVSTMIADASIQGELALSNTQAIWITTLYLLGVNTTVPTGNWFANQFGANRMYTYGVVIFSFASLLAGISTNFMTLVAARFLEGVGAGFIFPIGLSLIVQSMPKEKIRVAVNMYIGIAFGAGLSIGIFLSGYLSQFESWRDVFFLIFPIGVLATASCWLCRKPVPETKKTPFDLFGFTTFFLFIASLLIALTMAPIPATTEGWRSPYIIGLLATAAFSLIACILIEKRHPNPLIPLSLFKDPIFSVGLAAMLLLGMATFASVSVTVNYMLNGLFYEKFTAGKIAAVYGLTIGVFSILASYISKIIPIPFLTFTGLGLLVFSYFYNNELSWLTGYTQVITILLIRGIGIGLSLGPTTILTLSGLPPELRASGTTILTFFRQIGGTYGGTIIAIFSIRQTILHTARFGEQANTQLPAYKMTFHNLYDKFPDAALAKAAIIHNIKTQAYIQGLNDALIVIGYVTGAVGLILMTLIGLRMWKSRKNADS
jgi:EmrB/QacA subfamily drug resistance transporter